MPLRALLPLWALLTLVGRLLALWVRLALWALLTLVGRLRALGTRLALWARLPLAGRLLPLGTLLALVRRLRRAVALWGSLSLHLSLRRRRLRGHRIRRTLAVTALLFGRRVLREDIVHKRILSRAPAWGIGARLRGLLIVGHRRTLRGDRYGWSVSSV